MIYPKEIEIFYPILVISFYTPTITSCHVFVGFFLSILNTVYFIKKEIYCDKLCWMKYKMENPKWEHRNFIHQEQIFLMNIGMHYIYPAMLNVCMFLCSFFGPFPLLERQSSKNYKHMPRNSNLLIIVLC